jgi:hypothetical protein
MVAVDTPEDSTGPGTPPPPRVAAQLKTLVTPVSLQTLARLLLPRLPTGTPPAGTPTPGDAPPPQARRVWAFSRLLERCLATASLCNLTRVAFAVSPSLVHLLWNEYLKVTLSPTPPHPTHPTLIFPTAQDPHSHPSP